MSLRRLKWRNFRLHRSVFTHLQAIKKEFHLQKESRALPKPQGQQAKEIKFKNISKARLPTTALKHLLTFNQEAYSVKPLKH